MKISKETLNVLSNFASINQNINFAAGNVIKTKAPSSYSLLATATVPEQWPVDFSVYELSKLLTTLSLFEDPELEFTSENVSVSNGASSATYAFSDPGLVDGITDYGKVFEMPVPKLKFTLSDADFKRIQKSAKLFGAEDINIKSGSNNSVLISSNSAAISATNSNNFMVEIPTDGVYNSEVSVDIKLELLKFLPGDYEVVVGVVESEDKSTPDMGVCKFKNTTSDVVTIEYILAGTVPTV